KRRKRIERKERRKREKAEERWSRSEFWASFDAALDIGVSQVLTEEFKEQYSLSVSREYYPVKLPRPSRCNPFKAAALKAYEDFLAKRDIGVSYPRLSYKNNYKNNSSSFTSFYAWEGLVLSHSWCESKDYVKVIEPYFRANLEYADSHVLVFQPMLSFLFSSFGLEKPSYIVIPYTTRFHESYKRKILKQLEGVYFEEGTHLILTTDLDSYPDIISAVIELRRRASNVLSFLRRELKYYHEFREGKRKKPPRRHFWKGLEECSSWIFDFSKGIPPKDLRYICVLEFSFKRGVGSPHLHILLDRIYLNKCGLAVIRWGIMYPHSYQMKVVRFRGLKVKKYVMKYAKKLLIVSTESSESVWYSACLYWLTGRRLFSTSRDLISSGGKKERRYHFLGIYPKLLRGVYPIEENLNRLDDFDFREEVRFHDEWLWSSCIRKLKAG
ncbi:hypothetical protein DRO29_05595, partial [Candidatus Bathyarchaeota archaeon]